VVVLNFKNKLFTVVHRMVGEWQGAWYVVLLISRGLQNESSL